MDNPPKKAKENKTSSLGKIHGSALVSILGANIDVCNCRNNSSVFKEIGQEKLKLTWQDLKRLNHNRDAFLAAAYF